MDSAHSQPYLQISLSHRIALGWYLVILNAGHVEFLNSPRLPLFCKAKQGTVFCLLVSFRQPLPAAVLAAANPTPVDTVAGIKTPVSCAVWLILRPVQQEEAAKGGGATSDRGPKGGLGAKGPWSKGAAATPYLDA